MELRQLRYFVAVAEELHFTRAAERLHISPPSLTEQIKVLEQKLEVQLLVRTKRSVAMTDAGARFLEEARAVLRQAERAGLAARQAGRGEIGRVEVGYLFTAVCSGLFTEAVSDYRRKHPLVTLNLRRLDTARQLDELAEGRLDVGFLRSAGKYPAGVAAMIVETQPAVVALPVHHRLATRRSISPRMLAGEPFIAGTHESQLAFHHPSIALGQQGKFAVRVVERAPDILTFVTLVATGVGIAVLPKSTSCIQVPGVVYRSLSPALKPLELAVAFRRDEQAPAARAFVEYLRKYRAR
jgi:DNA-binding transcriptional LysR family regulator